MEVILREHVDNLGQRGDVVKVAAGYARNFLLPRKLALLVTAGNRKQIERERVKFEARELEEQRVAEAVAGRMADLEIVHRAQGRRDRSRCTDRSRRPTSRKRWPPGASRSSVADCSCPNRSRRSATSTSRSSCTARSPRR